MSPKSRDSLCKKALVAVLGSLGAGASGSVTNNELSQLNAAPVAPSTNPRFDSSAFVTKTGRVLVIANVTFSKNGGTLAAADVLTVNLCRDSGGGQATIGAQERVVAATAGSDVVASATLCWVDAGLVPGASHTYAIFASNISSAHTAGILAAEVAVTVIDL